MTREKVIKIINDDPKLTTEQMAAILEKFEDCYARLFQEIEEFVNKYDCDEDTVIEETFNICFILGYVYASLELNGEVKV